MGFKGGRDQAGGRCQDSTMVLVTGIGFLKDQAERRSVVLSGWAVAPRP